MNSRWQKRSIRKLPRHRARYKDLAKVVIVHVYFAIRGVIYSFFFKKRKDLSFFTLDV